MGRLASFLITVWLLGGCSEADPPTVKTPVLPGSISSENSLSASPPLARPDKQIIVAADPWCPHNCAVGAAREGYMVDIAREAMAMAGYTLEYRNISWARALRMTREGKFHAVVGAFRTDAPDFVFPEVAQGRASIALFTRSDSDWFYTGIPSLENQTLLAINGYSYTAELDNYIRKNQDNRKRIWILSGSTPLSRALTLVEKNWTDVFVADEYVIAWAMRNKSGTEGLRKAGQLGETLSYLAFSPALEKSAELARILSEGTRILIENGRVAAIMDSYGLTALPELP